MVGVVVVILVVKVIIVAKVLAVVAKWYNDSAGGVCDKKNYGAILGSIAYLLHVCINLFQM